MVIIIVIIFTWILARKSCIFNYNNENNDHTHTHTHTQKKNSYLKSISLQMIRWFDEFDFLTENLDGGC